MKTARKSFSISLVVCILLALVCMTAVYGVGEPYDTWAAAGEAAAENTDYSISGDTYTIKTAKGLAWFAYAVNSGNTFSGKTVELEDNISLDCGIVTGYSCTDDEFGTNITATNSWIPIGNNWVDSKYFTGAFDGKGHTISGVKINDSSANNKGLFGHINSAAIKNLSVTNSKIVANNTVGGIVAFSHDKGSTIVNCYCTASVKGTQFVGGIIGASTGYVKNCYYAGTVEKMNNTDTATSFACIAGSKLTGSPTNPISNCFYLNLNESLNYAVGYPAVTEDTTLNIKAISEAMKATSGDGTLISELNQWVAHSMDVSLYKWQVQAGEYPKFSSILTSDDFLYKLSFNTNGHGDNPAPIMLHL